MNTLELNTIMRFVVPIFTGVWLLVEGVRLYLGHSGNLRERVPELAAFLLLTLFPQVIVVIFLSFVALNRLPIDLIIGIPQIVLLLLEVRESYRTVRRLMQKQTAEFFRACQVDTEGPGLLASADSPRGAPPALPPPPPTAMDIAREGLRGLTQVGGGGSSSGRPKAKPE